MMGLVAQRPSLRPEWTGTPPAATSLPPSRGSSRRGALIALAVVIGWIVLVVGGLALFGLVAGDPYGRTYVERRADGYYLGVRNCEPTAISSVEVSLYDEEASTPPPPIWTTSTTSDGLRTLKLFDENPGFKTQALQPSYPATTYVILANPASAYSYLTTDLTTLGLGQLDYGGPKTVTREAYEQLSNSKFGCG